MKKKMMILGSVIVLIFVLLILSAILNYLEIQKEQKEERMATENFGSIAEILEYYECEWIKTKENTEGNFLVDIETTFRYDLYENGESKEEFFNSVIDAIAKFLNYKNFKMIDKQKEEVIEIQVMCDGKKVRKIYINGIEDYFIYKNSQMSLSQYEKIETTEISIQAPELLNCIQNNWSTKTDFGTRETIFQDYYVYFDEGIKTRKISGKIYNIIFTNNYVKPVVNGFTVGEKYDIIIRELGNPTFQNKEKNVIGYKSKDVYVFFEENQISIYRNTIEDGFDEFFNQVDKLLNDEYTLLEFMNELTYLWPDYDEYTYDAETVFLSYPNKGIDIKMNYDNTNGIVLYNNMGADQSRISQYLDHTEFVAKFQEDNVYQAELRRVKKESEFAAKCKEYQTKFEAEDTRNRGNVYHYYMEMSKEDKIVCTYFLSQDPQYPNCELSETINSYIWLSDFVFVYSIANKGIYYYDLKNQVKGVVVTGEENFQIKSYQDGVLKYDDYELEVKY